MISLGAAIVRAALRAYTYPYRKRFASLSRSIAPKNKPYVPHKGFAFAVEEYGGVRVEKVVPPECGKGAVLQFHGGGHTVPMNMMYRKAAERLAANCGCTVYSIDYHTGARLTYPPCMTNATVLMRRFAKACCGEAILSPSGIVSAQTCFFPLACGQGSGAFRCRLRSSASPPLSTWRLPEIHIGRIVIWILFMRCQSAAALRNMKRSSAAFRPIAGIRRRTIPVFRPHMPSFTGFQRRSSCAAGGKLR